MTGADPLHHPQAYFDGVYRDDDDPWGFDSAWYERRKYDLTVAALPRERYRRAVEPGCANGALTERLRDRCDQVDAYDLLEGPVGRARERLGDTNGVHVEQAAFPEHWPQGTGDLVVWSEVAYYLTQPGRDTAADGLQRYLEPGGHLVCVHYTLPTNYPMDGRQVGQWVDTLSWLRRIVAYSESAFELGVWERIA